MASLNDIYGMDVAFAYREAGVSVVYGTHTTRGILLNEPLEVLQMNSKTYAVQDTTLTVTIVTGTLGTLKNNTAIVVAGGSYQINKWVLLGIGQETKIWILAV